MEQEFAPAPHAERAAAVVGDFAMAGSVGALRCWRGAPLRPVGELRLETVKDAPQQRLTDAVAWRVGRGVRCRAVTKLHGAFKVQCP